MNKFNFNKLTPFKWFILENFPFIEADFDALTEWQLFCKLGKEMNKIINSENTLGTQMENVTNAFIDLQNYINNYFDNLDVQEEINTKLNEMVEDGTFTTLIENYILPVIENTIPQKVQISSLGIEEGELTEANVDMINSYIQEHSYCDLQFGKGTYILPKPIVLLQGRSICGVGNSTKLVAPLGEFAIIAKGVSTINSTTEISHMTIVGNFEGNGIYIDGTRYSRCEIHDIFIVSCLYGIRNAVPTVSDVYDNNFSSGNGGNNIHDIYIFGEAPNDDSSRCKIGIQNYANDNMLSNIRISGFGEYGLYVQGANNTFNQVKSAVNHIGVYMTGKIQTGFIIAEECFENCFEFSYLRDSNLKLKASSAGCVVSDTMPSVLNYYCIKMENCSNNIILANGLVAQSLTYRKSGELAYLYLYNSTLNNIKCYYDNGITNPNEYCLPIMSNCGFINEIEINNFNYNKFINYQDFEITKRNPSNVVITGDYPNYTCVYSGSNTVGNIFSFDVNLDNLNKKHLISDKSINCYSNTFALTYKFNEEQSSHSYVSGNQFNSNFGNNGSYFVAFTPAEILSTLADYISGVQNNYTLEYVRFSIRSNHLQTGTSYHEIRVINGTNF